MALGSWKDPQTGIWMDLYDTEADLPDPTVFPRGDYCAFQNPSEAANEGKELLYYPQASSNSAMMYHATILASKPVALPMEAYPFMVASATGGKYYGVNRTQLGDAYYQLMAEDGISPMAIGPQPTPNPFPIALALIVLLIISVTITVGIVIWSGQQTQVQLAAMAAQSQEVEFDNFYDTNGDGEDDIRVIKYRSGFMTTIALNDVGKAYLGGKTSVVNEEGLDWQGVLDAAAGGDIPWGWIALGGGVLVGVVILMKVGKGDPFKGMMKMQQMAMQSEIMKGFTQSA